jgi:hypothetical protein
MASALIDVIAELLVVAERAAIRILPDTISMMSEATADVGSLVGDGVENVGQMTDETISSLSQGGGKLFRLVFKDISRIEKTAGLDGRLDKALGVPAEFSDWKSALGVGLVNLLSAQKAAETIHTYIHGTIWLRNQTSQSAHFFLNFETGPNKFQGASVVVPAGQAKPVAVASVVLPPSAGFSSLAHGATQGLVGVAVYPSGGPVVPKQVPFACKSGYKNIANVCWKGAQSYVTSQCPSNAPWYDDKATSGCFTGCGAPGWRETIGNGFGNFQCNYPGLGNTYNNSGTIDAKTAGHNATYTFAPNTNNAQEGSTAVTKSDVTSGCVFHIANMSHKLLTLNIATTGAWPTQNAFTNGTETVEPGSTYWSPSSGPYMWDFPTIVSMQIEGASWPSGQTPVLRAHFNEDTHFPADQDSFVMNVYCIISPSYHVIICGDQTQWDSALVNYRCLYNTPVPSSINTHNGNCPNNYNEVDASQCGGMTPCCKAQYVSCAPFSNCNSTFAPGTTSPSKGASSCPVVWGRTGSVMTSTAVTQAMNKSTPSSSLQTYEPSMGPLVRSNDTRIKVPLSANETPWNGRTQNCATWPSGQPGITNVVCDAAKGQTGTLHQVRYTACKQWGYDAQNNVPVCTTPYAATRAGSSDACWARCLASAEQGHPCNAAWFWNPVSSNSSQPPFTTTRDCILLRTQVPYESGSTMSGVSQLESKGICACQDGLATDGICVMSDPAVRVWFDGVQQDVVNGVEVQNAECNPQSASAKAGAAAIHYNATTNQFQYHVSAAADVSAMLQSCPWRTNVMC